VQYLFPAFPIHASKCPEFLSLYEEIKKGKSPHRAEALRIITQTNAIRSCCMTTTREELASAFAEELIFRVGVQTLVPFALNKAASLLPAKKTAKMRHKAQPKPGYLDKIRTVLTHPATRILVTSAIFALAHERPHNPQENIVITQFTSSILYGAVYQGGGFFASTLAHSVQNLANVYFGLAKCDSALAGVLADRLALI
jgi:hypothetical protein